MLVLIYKNNLDHLLIKLLLYYSFVYYSAFKLSVGLLMAVR